MFEGRAEAGPPPDMRPGRAYVAGRSFFDPHGFAHLASNLSPGVIAS